MLSLINLTKAKINKTAPKPLKKKKKKKSNKKTYIEPTIENLGYLQDIYEKNKSTKAIKRQNEEQNIRE